MYVVNHVGFIFNKYVNQLKEDRYLNSRYKYSQSYCFVISYLFFEIQHFLHKYAHKFIHMCTNRCFSLNTIILNHATYKKNYATQSMKYRL